MQPEARPAALLTFLVYQILKEAQDQALRRRIEYDAEHTKGTFGSIAFSALPFRLAASLRTNPFHTTVVREGTRFAFDGQPHQDRRIQSCLPLRQTKVQMRIRLQSYFFCEEQKAICG